MIAYLWLFSKSINKRVHSFMIYLCSIKGLVTNYGEGEGLQKRRGRVGHLKFCPYEKGGEKKVLAMLKRRYKKFWGRFYVVA